jgi:hypothetical protein
MMQSQQNTGGDVASMIEKLPDLVNADAALVRRGRTLTVDVLIEVGQTPYYLSIVGPRCPHRARSAAHALLGLRHPRQRTGLAPILAADAAAALP